MFLNSFKAFKKSFKMIFLFDLWIFLWNSTFMLFQIIAIWFDTAKLVDLNAFNIIDAYFRNSPWFLAFSNVYFFFIKIKSAMFDFFLNLVSNLTNQCFMFDAYFINALTFKVISLIYHCRVSSRRQMNRLSLISWSSFIAAIFEHRSKNRWMSLK